MEKWWRIKHHYQLLRATCSRAKVLFLLFFCFCSAAWVMGTYFFYQRKHVFASLDQKEWEQIWEIMRIEDKIDPVFAVEKIPIPKEEKVKIKSKVFEKKSMIAINEADPVTLMQIKGIGTVFSERIVKYREKLGGFYSLDQLLEVYGISEDLYQQIKNCCLVEQEKIKKININTMSAQDLATHPYIDYKKAKVLVAFRESHGIFQKTDDLLKIALIDSVWLKRITPYLAF